MNVERWGWYSILVNVVLVGLHAVIVTASGSLAVTAERVHNLVDLLTAVAVPAGLKIAARKSKDFPYGLYEVENLVAAGLAGMVFVSAWEIVRQARLAPAASWPTRTAGGSSPAASPRWAWPWGHPSWCCKTGGAARCW